MSVDINEEIRLWGGFTVAEFWIGAGVLFALFFLVALGLSPILGLAGSLLVFGAAATSFALFWTYQRDLPKGYLLRRWGQEGRFLFFRVPGFQAQQVLPPPSRGRRQAFEKEFDRGGA